MSGLLWQKNLIMYNRSTDGSLWPQMLAEARCGPDAGSSLARYPAIDMTWAGWKGLHPNTLVVFWDTEALGAVALPPFLGGVRMTFLVTDTGIFDTSTNSRWGVDGIAITGSLEGLRLEAVSEAYVAFWGAWAAFHPDTELWTGE